MAYAVDVGVDVIVVCVVVFNVNVLRMRPLWFMVSIITFFKYIA